ncbi:two-component response regulator and GGDEF family protein YeaJ [Vibrio orientalis CIP 102891 = ATCC 33934]|uniref:diguanylate cyclase n=1 Tax=Vibrio orientalis CIP 102891 = ATCC 33934 TaxID=675816 RepID=C9QJS4_VIBOR|nr:diguanylate cyclase [Vibrio orientalis]EEX91919.1 putative two-component response regulator and GGDEF family protein YeaJ [Vibrio orientalis CIP 102891 = ATCC 33934]EGU53754.1 two-component response regulator and GGDEF family protein YeaJ [Vibrio orientalis CIP 102891 = ATCC 33934]
MNVKDHKWNVAFNSLALAFISYSIIFILYSISEVADKKANFAYATEYLDKQKQRLVYTSLFVNTVFHINGDKLNKIYDESGTYGLDIYVYPVTGGDLEIKGKEEIIVSSMIYAFGNMNSFIGKENSLIYYRSYENDGKLMSFSRLDDFQFDKNMFNQERCQMYNLCSTYATKESLSDRLLVSSIYNDTITGSKTITLSSPVIDQGKVIGDISADIYFDMSILAQEASISSRDQGGMNYIYVDYPQYPMGELSFRSSYVIDNKSTLVFELPISKLILDTLPFFVLSLVISLFATVHYMQYKIQKKRFSEVYEESNRDEMTGLYNRKVFSTPEFLSDTLNQTIAILAIDGNKLKTINDTYGHHCGDAAIKHIAEAMKGVFRDTDYVVRSGGDEFLVILPGCPTPRVMELKEKLKKEVARKKVRPYNMEVSVSVGIAFKRPEEELEYALIAADENLYRDKAQPSDEPEGLDKAC